MMQKLIKFIPLILFIVLALLLYRGLFLNPKDVPSALVGKPMPAFSLPSLKQPERTLTEQDLKGEIILLNFWGTWCVYCKYEHPYLLDLAKRHDFVLYGVNYKDERAAALQWLEEYKTPYKLNVFDEMGSLGLDLGVSGAPETFVIDKHGIIRLRFQGPIDANVWQQEFAPLIAKLKEEA